MKTSRILSLWTGLLLIGTQNVPAAGTGSKGGAALAVGKSASTATTNIGAIFTYQLSVTNVGSSEVTTGVVEDILPAGVQYLSSSPAGEYDPTNSLWTFNSLFPGVVAVLSIQVLATNTGYWLNTATITNSTPANTNTANSTASAGVTINAATNPPIMLTCSSNITVAATGSSGAVVYFTNTATGGCAPPDVTADPPSGSIFSIGTNTVETTASDTCGDSTNCSFTVTVVDPPIVLTCSPDITVPAMSSNGAVVYFTCTATGGCTAPYVYVNPPSGYTFPIGTTTVFTYAIDNCFGSTNCSFTVTVTPSTYPPIVLTCSTNITATATSTNGAVVYFTCTATGGCSPPGVGSYPPSGSTFPIGVTTVYTAAVDNCTTDYCSFTVTVKPQSYTPIVLNCSTNITVTATSSNGTVVYFTSTATGGCSTPNVSSDPPSGSTFPIGVTTVHTSASDICGDSNTCSFTVTVNPASGYFANAMLQLFLQTPALNIESVTLTGSMTVTSSVGPDGQASGTNSSGLDYVDTELTSLNVSGYNSALGPVMATLNSSQISSGQVIENVNNTPGILDVPPFTSTGTAFSFFDVFVDIQVGSLPPMFPATPPYFDGTITEFPSGPGDTLGNSVTIPLLDINGNPTGYYLVGGQLTASLATNAPAPIDLTCSSNLTVTADNEEGASVFFNVSASGGCGPLNLYTYPSTGDFFPIGITTVYVIASDECGDATNCSFTVDVVLPTMVLDCSSNITVTASSSAGAAVYYNVTASGDCDSPPNVYSDPPSGSLFPVGTTTVTSIASDACGDLATCSFTVTVNPPAYPPIDLDCSSNITVTAASSSGTAVYYNVMASGGCSLPTISSYPPSGSIFPIGATTVYSTAGDTCGDSTNCIFTVTVNPPVYPPIVLNCSSNITVTATSSSGAAVYYNETASGGCTLPTISSYPPSGSIFPMGATTVYTTAADTCGNSTNCSFTVTVNPPVYPPIMLSCSSNITVTATSSSGAAVYYNVTASGGCSLPAISSYPPSGSTFPIGVTTVYTTASDTCGGSTNCSFTVTVVRPPIALNCSSNITVTATSSDGATVFFNVTASGGCTLPRVTVVPPSGSLFPIGDTMVYSVAGDTCENYTDCVFTVRVNPGTNSPAGGGGPKLSLHLAGNNHIVLGWPTNTAGTTYLVSQIASLTATNWQTLSNSPTVVGSSNQLDIVITNTQGFFRLTSETTNTVSTCLVSLTLTNCDLPEAVKLTSLFSNITVNAGSPVNLSAGLNITAGLVAMVTYYTNGTGPSSNCPPVYETNVVSPAIISSGWMANGPSGFTASGTGLAAAFTPAGCGSGAVEFSVTWQHVCDAGQSTAFASAAYNVNCATSCRASGMSTNCTLPGTMVLTNTTGAATNFCFNSPVTLSVTNLVTTNGQWVITTMYTNAAGATTSNCPPTYATNAVPPLVVSNWWTVSGPGVYTNSGAGTTAMFTPTNGGRGTVVFNLTYANKSPCATNVQAAQPVLVQFNVIQITNLAVAVTPANRTRLTVGVGERVSLALAGNPGGNYTWTTTAGGLVPTNGLATAFTAPSNAANATVSVNYKNGNCSLQFTVIEPTGFVTSNSPVAQNGYPVGRAGAGMTNYTYIVPQTVSFYRIRTQEVPATSNLVVSGYFANTNFFPTGPQKHDAAAGAGSWVGTGAYNYNGYDTAASGTGMVGHKPWVAGTLTWPIPVVWAIPGGVPGSGPTNSSLGRTDQTFMVNTNGTVTVLKYGNSVSRTTNGVYTLNP